jgi:hypothetical protein
VRNIFVSVGIRARNSTISPSWVTWGGASACKIEPPGSGPRSTLFFGLDRPLLTDRARRALAQGALLSPYRSGRSRHWVKSKNPAAPAVKREAEEDWGKDRVAMKKHPYQRNTPLGGLKKNCAN